MLKLTRSTLPKSSLSPERLDEMLSVAKGSCRAAADAMGVRGADAKAVVVSKDHDIKLSADLISHATISSYLKNHSDLPVCSEEDPGALQDLIKAQAPFWLIDPVDGTVNFFRGIPISCISVALCEGLIPRLGSVFDFNRNELFAGISSVSSDLNGVPIKVSDTKSASEAILFSGIPSGNIHEEGRLRELVSAMARYRKVRLIGSAALSVAYVACGRGDVYSERGIYFWDVAAGAAIVLGAGGGVQITSTSDSLRFDVVTSNLAMSNGG